MTVIDWGRRVWFPNADLIRDAYLLLDLELLCVNDSPFDVVQRHFQLYDFRELTHCAAQQDTDL